KCGQQPQRGQFRSGGGLHAFLRWLHFMSRIFGLLQQEFNRLQAMISSGMNKASPISASAQASPATAMLMAPVFRAVFCGLTSNATQIRSSSALNGMVRWNTEEGK